MDKTGELIAEMRAKESDLGGNAFAMHPGSARDLLLRGALALEQSAAREGALAALVREILAVMDNEDRTPEEMLLLERASQMVNTHD